MRHPELEEWEKTLKKMFDEIDDYLEDKYGNLYPLHPNRAERGETSNKESDGLFNVGCAFSAGYGSEIGRGYVIEIHMSTLSEIPDEIKKIINKETIDIVRAKIRTFFPHRELDVKKDGNIYKIYGDLSLGAI
jgi:hypothetical protein